VATTTTLMNTAWTRVLLGLLAGGLIWVAGCASQKIDWGSRVGTYSFDDAIREYGPPDKSAKLTDGSTVADWLTARGMQTATTYGAGGYGYRRHGYGWAGPTMVVVDPPSPDRFLRLTFDPEGKLASWQKVVR